MTVDTSRHLATLRRKSGSSRKRARSNFHAIGYGRRVILSLLSNNNWYCERNEIKRLVEAANNLRDKALILVLAESGSRIGEILSLTIGDIEFENMGVRLLVDGKTGRDHVRIIASAPMLATWLDNHPLRNDPKAPVWVTWYGETRQICYAAVLEILKDCVKRAGLKKRVWFHLFRHTRGTQASKLLTSSQLCPLMGWRQDSKMRSVYIHLAGEDIDEAQAIMNGVKVESEKESKLEPLVCTRCNHMNSATAKFCNKCGMVLDLKTSVEMDNARNKIDVLIDKLVKDPEKFLCRSSQSIFQEIVLNLHGCRWEGISC